MTTLEHTILPHGNGPFRTLGWGPGEAHQLLGGAAAGVTPSRLVGLTALWHLTDVHVLDPASPLRIPFLHRHTEPGGALRDALGPLGAYRPHEPLTLHVLAAMLEAMARIERSPLLGLPLELIVASGDLIDNAQHNELRRFLELAATDVAETQPLGFADRWEGLGGEADGVDWSWHPEGPSRDVWRRERGFPELPGFFDALRTPVRAPRPTLPALLVEGNHDVLIQGTVPPSSELAAFAQRGLAPIALKPDLDVAEVLRGHDHRAPDPRALVAGARWRRVSPDPSRSHRRPGQAPFVHRRRIDLGWARLLVLDTANPFGGWQGSLAHETLTWLTTELETAHSVKVDDDGHLVACPGEDVPVILVSHHPLETLVNPTVPRDVEPRHTRADVAHLLAHYPNVMAWLAGHTHRHRLRYERSPLGPFGIAHVTTASLIDWPQQARIVELAFDRDRGTLLIVSTVVDHTGSVNPLHEHDDDTLRWLAGISRLLAVNDPERLAASEPPGRAHPLDRNGIIEVPLAPRLAAVLARTTSRHGMPAPRVSS